MGRCGHGILRGRRGRGPEQPAQMGHGPETLRPQEMRLKVGALSGREPSDAIITRISLERHLVLQGHARIVLHGLLAVEEGDVHAFQHPHTSIS